VSLIEVKVATRIRPRASDPTAASPQITGRSASPQTMQTNSNSNVICKPYCHSNANVICKPHCHWSCAKYAGTWCMTWARWASEVGSLHLHLVRYVPQDLLKRLFLCTAAAITKATLPNPPPRGGNLTHLPPRGGGGERNGRRKGDCTQTTNMKPNLSLIDVSGCLHEARPKKVQQLPRTSLRCLCDDKPTRNHASA
jgi:hypothetical protein